MFYRFHAYIYLIIILGIIISVFSTEISVDSKDQLLKGFNINEQIKELFVNIEDVNIDLEEKIILNNKIEKLYIQGKTKNYQL